MSISGALYNALSSMAAEQAQSQVIANNVANANTVGYVRRTVTVSESVAAGVGQGVAVGVTQRAGSALLEATQRSANSDQGYGDRMAASLATLTQAIGDPADGVSLSAKFTAFQSSLTALAATPADTVAQAQVVAQAETLTDGLNSMDKSVADARGNADASISQDVTAVNAALDQLAKVETDLARASARGDSTAAFEDQRATLLADISAKVPVKILNSGPGMLIVKTDQGTSLFDSGTVHKLAFSGSSGLGSTTAVATQVTVDGLPLRSSASGSIAAALRLRDQTLPAYGQMLDQIAGNLAGGFQAADPSATGSPRLAGLFSRGNAATLDTTNSAGLAGSISVNPKVVANPALLRDGANASAAGPASNNSLVLAGLNVLDGNASYSVPGLPTSTSLANAAAQAVGLLRGDSADWTTRSTTRSAAAAQANQQLANNTGVNVDEEMQKLLVVQHTYAASAQVIQTVAKMLDTLNSLNA